MKHENVVWRKINGLMKKNGVLELMEYGFNFQESDNTKIIEYFFRFIQAYKERLPSETVASRSGWKNNYSQFVIGNKVVSAEGVFDILQIDNSAAEMYSQIGNVEEWAKGVNDALLLQPIRFKAYAAGSCLLLRRIDISNYLFDQCCGTGRFKSFSNKLIASFFGHPRKLQLDTRSTKVGLAKLVEACNDLPMFLDETSQNIEFVMDLIYWFANGNTRVKSNSLQGLDIAENFCAALFATGEDPLVTENSKGGHYVRRVPETHGVPSEANGEPKIIDTDIINKAKTAMKNNYGHVSILFIREIIINSSEIEEKYKECYSKLPEIANITSGRLKELYACILTSGYILEKVFVKIGINVADPLSIVSNYFEENVLNGVAEPDHVKMLRIAYDLYIANKAHFEDEEGSQDIYDNEKKELMEKYGWVKSVNGEVTINFRPEALKRHITHT